MILLTIPIFLPLVLGLDFGMSQEMVAIWFGVMVLMTVGFGLLAPPVGLNVYVVNGMARDVPVAESYRGVMPFLATDALRTVLLLFFPADAVAGDGCALPWEVITSVKVHELCKFHSEFPASSPALYTSVFVMSMNKAKDDSLAPELKKVIDANSGADVSAWMGKVQQDYDPVSRKLVVDRGNTVHTFGAAETAEFQKLTSHVDEEWVADMDKRGHDGKKLLSTAKALIAKYSKAT